MDNLSSSEITESHSQKSANLRALDCFNRILMSGVSSVSCARGSHTSSNLGAPSILLLGVLLNFLLAACAPGAASETDFNAMNPPSDLSTTHTGLNANYATTRTSGHPWDIIAWGKSPLTNSFMQATVTALKNYGGNLIASTPRDIGSFCPGYSGFNNDQKAGFWVALVAGMVSRESSFEPTSMFRDDSMGQDRVTGQPLWSEGLLQISYQDQMTYKGYVPAGACDFDYASDRDLPRKDIRRTLQNPERNLRCGVAMINSLIRQDNQIAGFKSSNYLGASRYWAVLRRNPNLQSIRLRTLNYCEAIQSH